MEKFKVTRLGFANCSDNCVSRLYGPGPEPFDGASGDLLCRSEVVPATCIPHARRHSFLQGSGIFLEHPKFRCYWVKKTSQVSFSLQCLVVKVCNRMERTLYIIEYWIARLESHVLNRTSNCSCKTWLKQCLEIPWWLSRFIFLQVDASGLMMGWTILRWNKINHWLSVVENMAGFRGSACGSTWFQDAAANCQWKTSSLAMKPSKLIVYQPVPVPHLSACQQPSI